ncbi:MAG: response regulator [Elusimicrobia bacterium]|nr:response regulator [Elusimicrobiota bacterium]
MADTIPGKKTILIVDDNAFIVKMLQKKLESREFRVITAYDGESGITRALEEIPDLIILDIEMPGINGFETCERLKSGSRTENIPIIIFTSKDMGDDFDKAREKRADWYIIKPVSDEHLFSVIGKLI